MNKTINFIAVILATVATCFAGDVSQKIVVAPQTTGDLFRAGEFDIDAYAAGAAGVYDQTKATTEHHRVYDKKTSVYHEISHTFHKTSSTSVNGFGGGIGVNYFFTKYFGISVDDTLTSLNGNGHTYNSTQGDLIARLPIESIHLAPYVFVGGGATWGTATQGDGNVGLGLDYRFNRTFGIFADSRYLYGNNGLNESLTRAGLRFAF